MIYIITNNKRYEDHQIYFVIAPGFDMAMYIAVVNAKRVAYSPDLSGELEILGCAQEIIWGRSPCKTVEAFQREWDVEGWDVEVRDAGAFEDLAQFKTSEKGTK